MAGKAEKYRPFGGGYVSEFGQFMQGYLARHPEVEEDRMRGWYIWWDRRIDLHELEKQGREAIPIRAYVYD